MTDGSDDWGAKFNDYIRGGLAAVVGVGSLIGVLVAPTSGEKVFAAMAVAFCAGTVYITLVRR